MQTVSVFTLNNAQFVTMQLLFLNGYIHKKCMTFT